MDDATSEIYSAFRRGGRHRVHLRALKQVFPQGAAQQPLHRPRQPLLPHPRGRRQGAKDQHTQVGRALQQLGIEHIAAYSPEARGAPSALRHPPDRLVKELLAGIATVRRPLHRTPTCPTTTRRFATPPELGDSAFVPLEHGVDDILCRRTDRTVARDNTVRYERPVLQIPAPRQTPLRQGQGPGPRVSGRHPRPLPRARCLARYNANGEPIETQTRQAA